MQIDKKADFVLRGNKVISPPVRTDGLELYYDTKGKKNTDTYKNKLLDMSGNDRHGELQNFNYKNLSGYQEDSELVFDGVDDKLVLGDVEEPEIVSITKNLFDGEMEQGMFTWKNGTEYPSDNYYRSKKFVEVKPNTNYIINCPFQLLLYDKDYNYIGPGTDAHAVDSRGKQTTSDTKYLKFIMPKENKDDQLQLEEGTTATPYVPYIPSIRGTYQINNNIISYDGGTVRWVKDGKVMERKGINLIQNGNFLEEGNHWKLNSYFEISHGELIFTPPSNTGGSNIINSESSLVLDSMYYVSFELLDFDRDVGYFRYNVLNNGMRNISKTGLTQFVGQAKTNEFVVRLGHIAGDSKITNLQLINLTATFGAGNEPTLEEIQAEPDKWQWLPNPLDLIEAEELKGNILGDMEDIIDDHTRDEQSGVEVFTDKADDSLVRVDVDGKSYQHAKSDSNNLLPHPSNWEFSGGATLSSEGVITIPSGGSITVDYYWNGDTSTQRYGFEVLEGKGRLVNTQYFDVDGIGVVNTGGVHSSNGNGRNNLLLGEHDFGMPELDSSVHRVRVFILVTSQFGGDNTLKIRNLWGGSSNKIQAYELPAPTPDYPIEIHSLNDFDVVSSVGKRNIINKVETASSRLLTDIYFDSKMVVGKTYVLSFDFEFPEHITRPGSFRIFDLSSEIVTNTNLTAAGSFKLPSGRKGSASAYFTLISEYTGNSTSSGNPLKMRIHHGTYARGYVEATLSNLKLEEGSKPTAWVPNKEDITEDTNHPLIDKINLSLSEPLRSVGNVKDRLFRDSDGLWKIERNLEEYAVTGIGSESWGTDGYSRSGYNYAYFRPKNFVSHGEVRANILPIGTTGRESVISSTVVSFSISDSKTGVLPTDSSTQRINKVKNYVTSKNPVIIYQITPSVETLDQEFQDKLNNLRSFQYSNYVYTVINN